QEDLNPNAATAAKNLHRIVNNLRFILAIEFVAAAQALDLLPAPAIRKLGRGVQRAHTSIRSRIPFLARDEPLSPHIEALALMLRTSEWLP
ncbi:MAG: aromatic amino acid lyase, partial [Anaerolineales bacterium]